MKKLAAIILMLTMGFSLSACGGNTTQEETSADQEVQATEADETEAAAEQDNHINLAVGWEFELFYPIITPGNSASGYGVTYYLTNFYDTLVKYENGEVIGSLAESWELSEDGTLYTFYIREGVKFSDGSELTAEDVAKSLSAVPVNLGDYNGSYGKLSTIIESVTAIDDYTVEMLLTQSYYSTLRDLCLANPFGIVSSEQFNDDLTTKDSFETATYGTGPYMYEGDGNGQVYNFVKNPYYWDETPEVSSFSVHVIADNDAMTMALRSGEVDFISGNENISAENHEEMSNTEGFDSKVDENVMKTFYVGYNMSDSAFGDEAVRKAISAVLDKDDIVNSIYGGLNEKADTLFSQSLPYCDVDQTVYTFDIDAANALLDEAGYTDTDEDGIREINGENISADFLYMPGSASDDDLIVYICNQVQKIGIELTPKSAPMMDWYALITSGDYGLTVFRTQGGYYDPANVISNIDPAMSMDPIVLQINEYLPGKADLITEVNSSADEDRIQEIYDTILTTVADECLVTPLYYTRQIVIYNDKVADYGFAGDANFTEVQNIKLQ